MSRKNREQIHYTIAK